MIDIQKKDILIWAQAVCVATYILVALVLVLIGEIDFFHIIFSLYGYALIFLLSLLVVLAVYYLNRKKTPR